MDKHIAVVVPGPLSTRTGGSIYDRRLAEQLRLRGWAVDVVELDACAHPLAPPLKMAVDRLAAIGDGRVVLVDGLVFGTMPEIVEREAWRLRFVPIVHMPLCATPGLTPGESVWLRNMERRALVRAQHVVVTGRATLRHVESVLAGAGPIVTRIAPGTDLPVRSAGGRDRGRDVRLLCVANVTPGKGHDILLHALVEQDPGWTLVCAGSLERDASHATRIREAACELGVQSTITWAGELDADALEREYGQADVFVLATRAETYGMAVADAIAHHLPVVSTRTGEIPDIVKDGGVLAEPGDVTGFSMALRQAITDPDKRQQLAEGARRAAATLPTWADAADQMIEVLASVASRG